MFWAAIYDYTWVWPDADRFWAVWAKTRISDKPHQNLQTHVPRERNFKLAWEGEAVLHKMIFYGFPRFMDI